MLQNYIIEVLFKEQVCCVPGVGTFTIQHIPAHFNVVEQQLVPPRQQILFEERWDDEEACTIWIAQKENLIGSVAKMKTGVYVEQFKQQLNEGKPVSLPGIGSLHKDPYGHLVFTPQELPDTWEPLALQPVIRPENAPRVTVGNTEVVNQQVVDHTMAMPEDESSFRWWWIILPLLLIAVGAGGWYLWQQQQLQQDNQPETAVTPVLPPATDSLSQTPAQDTVPQVEPVAVTPVSDTLEYYAVFATYKTLEDGIKEYKRQVAWGNAIQLYTHDSLEYRMAYVIKSLPADTTAAKDSLRQAKLLKVLYLDPK